MEIPEFLEKLKETPRVWGKTLCGAIRSHDSLSCPISFFGPDGRNHVHFYKLIAEQLGLNSADTGKIVSAADNDLGCDPELRAKLLVACGL